MGDDRHTHGLLIPYREAFISKAIQEQVVHWAPTGRSDGEVTTEPQ